MEDDLKDRIAGDFLALIPLFHKQVFRVSHGISGIKAAQYRVLGALIKGGPLSMSEMGKRLYISKPYMTALADTLIENDWVERQPDSADRRVIRIAITPKGAEYLRESLDVYKNDFKLLLEGLSRDELEQLLHSIGHLQAILKKIP